MCWKNIKKIFEKSDLTFLKFTAGGRHAWYKRKDGLIIRKPIQ